MKRFIMATALLMAVSFSVFSADSATNAFVEGCRAYSQGDWASAKFILRKAVSYKQNVNPDAYYMLIASEVSDGDYKAALNHCDTYLSKFPNSVYYDRVSYLKGKVLYSLGENEKAIIVLSDFCHQNEDDELYPYALFYIGESLFAAYNYDEALSVFQQLVTDYPDSSKTPAASYRIESILQRGREEKLLYLLKQTGEEYLSAKEEYEKQLKLYNSESINSTRQKLADAQLRNEELERQVADLENQIAVIQNEMVTVEKERADALERAEAVERAGQLQNQNIERTVVKETKIPVEDEVPAKEPYDEKKDQLRMLKLKALEAQRMLDNKKD